MEQPIRHVEAPEETPEKTLGRRELLKVLAAAGGAVTANSLLPGEWAKPVVEVGVLPAHAQTSEPGNPPGITPGILGCTASGEGTGSADTVFQNDTILSTVDILPALDGVRMQRRITSDDPNHLVIVDDSALTSGGGHIDSSFDLSTLTPPVAFLAIIIVEYDFADSRYPGLHDPCSNQLEVVGD